MILIIDSDGLCYRSKYVLGELTYGNSNTEIIYGFLSQILSIAKKFNCNKLVFAWDSKESKRKDLFPEYRSDRMKKKKERSNYEKRMDKITHMQFKELRKYVLPAMGFSNVFVQRGHEADDIIADLALRSKEETIIVSSDQDLYQCLNGHVKMYSPATKKLITNETFQKEWGIPGYMWKVVKCIAGCKTDSVPGIPYKNKMMREKTAIKYLTGDLPKSHSIVQAIDENSKLIVDNEELVGLPMKGTRKFRLKPDKISRSKFMDTFSRYGLVSFKTYEWWSWVTAFNLIRKRIR